MNPTTMRRLRPAVTRRAGKGFSMLDVLVAIVIIGILVAAAIVGYSQMRQKASASTAKTDAEALATVLESSQSLSGSYVTKAEMDATSAPGADGKVHIKLPTYDVDQFLSAGNQLKLYEVVPATASAPAYFKFCIEHVANGQGDAHQIYDGSKGGMVQDANMAKAGCPASL